MDFDLAEIPVQARSRFIAQGRSMAPEAVLAQSEKTLEALERHEIRLEEHGFDTDRQEALRRFREKLVASLHPISEPEPESRKPTLDRRSTTSLAYVNLNTMDRARQLRISTRALLGAARERYSGSQSARSRTEDEINLAIERALEQTEGLPIDPMRLAEQLEVLRQTLNLPWLITFCRESGSPSLSIEVRAQIAALRRSTPTIRSQVTQPVADPDQIPLICGILVDLVRRARQAARSAACEAGDPDLARRFDLACLHSYRTTPRPVSSELSISGTWTNE
jgi:hypothetical protein